MTNRGHLRGQLPTIQSVGSKVGAEAQLAIGLGDFFDKAGKPADGGVMDELTTKECPKVRTVLAVIGKDAFAEFVEPAPVPDPWGTVRCATGWCGPGHRPRLASLDPLLLV
jgi:hypothetical protein